jgi:hypothetical protein
MGSLPAEHVIVLERLRTLSRASSPNPRLRLISAAHLSCTLDPDDPSRNVLSLNTYVLRAPFLRLMTKGFPFYS